MFRRNHIAVFRVTICSNMDNNDFKEPAAPIFTSTLMMATVKQR